LAKPIFVQCSFFLGKLIYTYYHLRERERKREREKKKEKERKREREREREREKECVENGVDTLLASIAASTIKIIHV